jgi:hypothetical protein
VVWTTWDRAVPFWLTAKTKIMDAMADRLANDNRPSCSGLGGVVSREGIPVVGRHRGQELRECPGSHRGGKFCDLRERWDCGVAQ